jgi:hypothetical protein
MSTSPDAIATAAPAAPKRGISSSAAIVCDASETALHVVATRSAPAA